MRRDRINSSIEHLKVLLEKEFHKQQPNVKLEKADILEMAVNYLQQQKNQHQTISVERLQRDYNQGYSWCVTEALQFLCHYPESGEAQKKLLNHLTVPQKVPVFPYLASSSDSKQATAASSPVKIWRPWWCGLDSTTKEGQIWLEISHVDLCRYGTVFIFHQYAWIQQQKLNSSKDCKASGYPLGLQYNISLWRERHLCNLKRTQRR